MIIKLLFALVLILVATYSVLLFFRRRSLNKGDDDTDSTTEPFSEGDFVCYCKKGKLPLIVKICKIHLDDKLVPFYTIRLPNGSERQTVGRYLKRDPRDEDDADIVDDEESPRFMGRLLSNPWVVFVFFSSREAKKDALKEAVDEVVADLDFAHSWPRLGPMPRHLALLFVVSYLLGMKSLTRVAFVGFKAFGAYYAMRLPYTYLTRPYYKFSAYHDAKQEDPYVEANREGPCY